MYNLFIFQAQSLKRAPVIKSAKTRLTYQHTDTESPTISRKAFRHEQATPPQKYGTFNENKQQENAGCVDNDSYSVSSLRSMWDRHSSKKKRRRKTKTNVTSDATPENANNKQKSVTKYGHNTVENKESAESYGFSKRKASSSGKDDVTYQTNCIISTHNILLDESRQGYDSLSDSCYEYIEEPATPTEQSSPSANLNNRKMHNLLRVKTGNLISDSSIHPSIMCCPIL